MFDYLGLGGQEINEQSPPTFGYLVEPTSSPLLIQIPMGKSLYTTNVPNGTKITTDGFLYETRTDIHLVVETDLELPIILSSLSKAKIMSIGFDAFLEVVQVTW